MVLYKEDHEMSREKRIEFTDPSPSSFPAIHPDFTFMDTSHKLFFGDSLTQPFFITHQEQVCSRHYMLTH